MPGTSRLNVNQSIWIRSGTTDKQDIFRSIRSALLERNKIVLTLNGPDDEAGFEKIKKTVWESDAHVILDGLTPVELRKLQPVFETRKNFSMALVDWWTSHYWFTQHAEYLIFRNYSGIAVRRGLTGFAAGRGHPPLFGLPNGWVRYAVICSAMRVPSLFAAPFLNVQKARQRSLEKFTPDRLLYFPFTIAEEHLPLKLESPEYDVTNVSSTGGYWIMRDPHASAWFNFGNMYYERLRLTNLVAGLPEFKLFRLQGSSVLKWDDYCNVIRRSRFVISTGGLHQTSVAKYAEFACQGTPMLGEEIPFEYPWLKDCLYPVDTLNVTQEKLRPQLREALALQPKLRENCLNLRSTLLKLYNAHRILDLLQEQADGKPMPPGYLKPAALADTTPRN
jgi:hypothetical protein